MTTILWADDQIDIAKSFATVLAAMDVEVEFVGNGTEAMEKVRSKRYDLILADLAMPPDRWGGLWLLEQLKSQGEDTPVIVVSGEGAQSETIQALRLGATDYITKEDLAAELPRRVSAALQLTNKRERELRELIEKGENDRLEFKSTLRFHLKAGRNDPVIELAVLKTIAAFLNSAGGVLLIGVEDAGKVVGIELDRFPDVDKFQLHFWNLVRQSIGAE
jgi:DNA-binding NtrC family response regulator